MTCPTMPWQRLRTICVLTSAPPGWAALGKVVTNDMEPAVFDVVGDHLPERLLQLQVLRAKHQAKLLPRSRTDFSRLVWLP